jgi:hypothetical protein
MVLVSVAVSACAAVPKPIPTKDLLAFISDGRTTCTDVIVHLGDPSQQYEDGHLLTYRIAGDSASRYAVVVAHDWSTANHSLVVQCGATGEVVAHSLVAVKRER